MDKLSAFVDLLQTTFAAATVEANEFAKVVKRVRKFSPVSLAQAFILAFLGNPRASAQHVAETASSLGIDISPQAVEQRYSPELQVFFETLFTKMVQTVVRADTLFASILDRFPRVSLMDSTFLGLPVSQAEKYRGGGVRGGAVKAGLKLQTELDLKSGALLRIQIEQGKSPDQATDRQHVRPTAGSLRITDLGYFNLAVFAMIHAAKAFYLSRTQHTVSLSSAGKRCNLIAWLSIQGVGKIDQEVVLGTANQLRCRLIAWRVPPDIEASRRRKTRQAMLDKGRNPSEQILASCAWEYLITNLSEEQLSFDEAIIMYRSRWQIELLFKRWKSYCEIDLLDGRTDEIKMTRLWIRLCAAILQHWLVLVIGWPEATKISFAKLAKLIRRRASEIASNLNATSKQLVSFLTRLSSLARRCCKRTKGVKKPGTFELLANPKLLEYR